MGYVITDVNIHWRNKSPLGECQEYPYAFVENAENIRVCRL